MAAPTEDNFPPDHIVDFEEAAMGWVLRLNPNHCVNCVDITLPFHRAIIQ